MYYKPDWEQAKKRLLAWWDHEIIDRACIAVHAPKKDSKMPPFPDLQHGPWPGGLEDVAIDDHETIEHWWVDPEWNQQRSITWFENNYFGGEALPVTYVNWGAMSMAAMYGSPRVFEKSSVWYPAVIDDWETFDWSFDAETNETWKTIQAIVDRQLEDAKGKYFVGTPELGNGADVLSLLRGMDILAMDLVMYPDQVKRGVDIISDTWVQLMEFMYQKTKDVNQDGDVLAWMGLWAPGRVDQIACDFSAIISPEMFVEFFMPEIIKMGNWCDYGVYHLDGPACLTHMLDILLEVEQINTIQFTPGVGFPPTTTPKYIPRLRKVLESGKNLYLLADPHEVETILSELPPEGLYMRTYVNTQEEAEDMLKKVARWSAKGKSMAAVDGLAAGSQVGSNDGTE
jgi:hypothetical protein